MKIKYLLLIATAILLTANIFLFRNYFLGTPLSNEFHELADPLLKDSSIVMGYPTRYFSKNINI